MLATIWTKTLWDNRRSLLGWVIGFAAVALIYTAFYPLAGTPEYADLIEGLPPALVDAMGWEDIASPAGYLGSTVFGLLGPVLISVMAIGFGARVIAGNEEDGSLEMLIAHPVTRTRVVVEKAAALLIAMILAAVVVLVAVFAIREPIDLDISLGNIAAASLNLALMGALFGYLALLVGSITGKRGLTIGISAGLVVFAFLADGFAPQIEALAWMQNLSPFYWADGTSALKDGLGAGDAGLLIVSAAAFVALAAVAFNRRDVGV